VPIPFLFFLNGAATVRNTESKVTAEWISAVQNFKENYQVQIETWN
jgi:hypothetical protein